MAASRKRKDHLLPNYLTCFMWEQLPLYSSNTDILIAKFTKWRPQGRGRTICMLIIEHVSCGSSFHYTHRTLIFLSQSYYIMYYLCWIIAVNVIFGLNPKPNKNKGMTIKQELFPSCTYRMHLPFVIH